MPTISVFIRKDDLPKWQAVENKSQFLSDALNIGLTVIPPAIVKPKDVAKKTVGAAEGVVYKVKAVNELCEHFAAKGLCKHHKCPNSIFYPKNRGKLS